MGELYPFSINLTMPAEDVNAELVIVGSHGRKALASAVIGSTANAVLHNAKADVMVIRI